MAWSSRSTYSPAPGARRTAIVGEHDGRLKVAVSAPPLDGRANVALVEMLSECLGLPQRALTVEAGATGRNKRLYAATMAPPEDVVRQLLQKQK